MVVMMKPPVIDAYVYNDYCAAEGHCEMYSCPVECIRIVGVPICLGCLLKAIPDRKDCCHED